MTRIRVLFSTESGNAEVAADDIAAAFGALGHETVVSDVADTSGHDLAASRVVILVSSTYGEGELPGSAEPFHDRLVRVRPDLSHMRFGAFGLGDSVYETFNNAIDILSATFTDLGARQIGDTAKHDANALDDVADLISSWVRTTAALLDDASDVLEAQTA